MECPLKADTYCEIINYLQDEMSKIALYCIQIAENG